MSCYAELIKIGTTSMTVKIEVWVTPVDQQEQYQVTEGIFVSVAIDEQGKPRPVPK